MWHAAACVPAMNDGPRGNPMSVDILITDIDDLLCRHECVRTNSFALIERALSSTIPATCLSKGSYYSEDPYWPLPTALHILHMRHKTSKLVIGS